MTTKFITLTNNAGGSEVLINPMLITALQSNPTLPFTSIYLIGGTSFSVREKVEEIMKLIQATDSMTIIQYDPKKP